MRTLQPSMLSIGYRWRLWLGVLLLTCSTHLAAHASAGQPGNTVVLVRIMHEIDLGIAPFLARVIDEANDAGALAVTLNIDAPGGRLDAVLQMRKTILNAHVRTIAYINR